AKQLSSSSGFPVGPPHASAVLQVAVVVLLLCGASSVSELTVALLSSGQVVVPEELRFPHACCVGIASQTSLSLFNPSERWQQVSITVVSLAIDGEKVDGLLYQWLMVKNKTIIGPKSTEEQKVLFVPPQPGVYQFILSVCSWPASAEAELAARANLFARRVVLVAVAENPIQVNTSGCLDFGDLPGGGAKCLPLRVLNRSHVTVPIRLVISANATAWRCFTFSKQPVTMTSEVTQQAVTSASSPSVMNHVMHASYGENPESFTVWVHFKAPQKFVASSEDLGPADEYSARVDVEVDSPGPSHVIRSVPLKARSGTARVHAPKDLQTVHLCAPEGKRSEQTVPLKNAGNIDVALKLKVILTHIPPVGWSLLTILVLPSGPQYEVTLKGEAVSPGSRKPGPPALSGDVPPILSNKQFVAWGGVTLGRAVQQKLVLRNNSTSSTQQLRLLIRGQDQDCFQLQSMFSPDECLTRHGELSIRPGDDVTVHLLFAPTRVACMLAKLEIKQSGVRPSQPGVKFIIPLSGYGGTSNIILEDQRKWGDGYVATLTDVAVGRVSKACLCVRNTGSRAAFIKAVAFSDVATRSVVEPSVISLAPSQFVLKERTQEVRSAEAPLATVCLFCGDEVSRQCQLMEFKMKRFNPQAPAPSPTLSSRYGQTFTHIITTLCLFLDGPSSTSQVQIQNNSSRELNFDLSWPAHCLTVTPQHGRIEPQSHLQILISPNPSLASRSTPLPWSGQMYLQCDGQQKLIKVQIRRDLALDVSAAPTDPALMALSPQAATPVLPVARISSQPSFTPQPFQVEIGNKTVTFPTTPSGETSVVYELKLWFLLFSQGVDDTEDVYRATYTAFRCSRVSGTLGANQKMQVPVTFLPRERGTYVQFWDLECHPVSDPQQKTRIRFQLSGTEGDCSLVRTETTAKSRKRADSSAPRTSQEEAVRRGVYSPQDLYTFPDTHVGESSTLKVNVRNNSSDTHELKFVKPMEPFHMKHLEYSLRSQHYVKLPVQFKPTTAGRHTGVLLVQSETSGSLVVQLSGEALP
uniref:Centrosomal protein 192kDa n=1 Tax=Nothobranchius furzeri TaxID=105023 RepID=A0A8C6NQH0_NOTFU